MTALGSLVHRALLVTNPKSRRGEAARPAIEKFAASGIDLTEIVCEAPEEVSRAIVAHRGAVDAVIVAGGDGTVNAAARGVIDSGLPLGILPLGTANDLARTLGLPVDLRAAAEVITAGATRQIDIGDVNGHPFFNVTTIGLAVELAENLTSDVKRRFGRFGYSLAAMKALIQVRPFTAVIGSADGDVRVRTVQIAVGNGRYYGGGVAVEESARIDDGHLDLYSLEVARVWKLALMLPSFKKGAHGAWQEVRTERGTSFEVRTTRPKAVNADGEIVTHTPARFTLRRRAVTVFVPAKP